jgi:hypothetical protein
MDVNVETARDIITQINRKFWHIFIAYNNGSPSISFSGTDFSKGHFQITTSLCINLNKKTKSELNVVCTGKLFNSVSAAVAFIKRLHAKELTDTLPQYENCCRLSQ